MIANGVYEFISSDYQKPLNMFGDNAGNAVNVNIYERHYDSTQRWVLLPQGNNTFKLGIQKNPTFVLDRWRGSQNTNNADIYTSATNAADNNDQIVQIEELYGAPDGGTYVRIRLVSDGYVLTAVNGENGTADGRASNSDGNVYFKSALSPYGQVWNAKYISAGPVPRQEAVVTEMPTDAGYTNRIEYFHPDAGMSSTTWTNNNGAWIESQIRNFYTTVYGTSPTSNSKYLHSLFGGKYVSGEYVGKYHPGIDVFLAEGSKIRSAHSGKVISSNNHFYVTIQLANGKKAIYVHLVPQVTNGMDISVGQVIGLESNQETKGGSHLHFELHNQNGGVAPLLPTTMLEPLGALLILIAIYNLIEKRGKTPLFFDVVKFSAQNKNL